MPCKAHRSIQRDDPLVPAHLTMVINTASSHRFQTRNGAYLTRTVYEWNKNLLDVNLNNISSSMSPSRVSLSLINARAMNITLPSMRVLTVHPHTADLIFAMPCLQTHFFCQHFLQLSQAHIARAHKKVEFVRWAACGTASWFCTRTIALTGASDFVCVIF